MSGQNTEAAPVAAEKSDALGAVKGYLGDLLSRRLLEFSVRDHCGIWYTVEEPTAP